MGFGDECWEPKVKNENEKNKDSDMKRSNNYLFIFRKSILLLRCRYNISHRTNHRKMNCFEWSSHFTISVLQI